MKQSIMQAAFAVQRMDEQLRLSLLQKNGVLQEKKLWENTFIKRQADRRKSKSSFSLSDHLRAMVYAMLSAGIRWERVEAQTDLVSGRLMLLDKIFHNYDPEFLATCKPSDLRDEVKALGCAGQYTLRQMTALVEKNLPLLVTIEKEYGSIDAFYRTYIQADPTLKSLVRGLSASNSPYNLLQMGEALAAEYLKNVGYDLAKPDRHICRILGKEYLGCYERVSVPVYEAIDLIAEIAQTINKPAAEVDYILWSYCANGYGGVCTKRKPSCEICVAYDMCNRGKERKCK